MPQKSYPQTINDLYNLQQFSIKQGLDNITRLCAYLGNPHSTYPVIHVAGTNGKGSTCTILQKILSAHGLKTGLYTSPHLIDFRERITIDDKKIEQKYIQEYWTDICNLVLEMKATFFDTTTALAFKYFSDKRVDVAIVETGLGGRLDSTNIVKPVAAVLTPIHRDHTKQLGIKLADITAEKADIIKNESTVFCGKQRMEVNKKLSSYHKTARNWINLNSAIQIRYKNIAKSVSTFNLTDHIRGISIKEIELALSGKHQIDNAALAYLVARWYLEEKEHTFSEEKFKRITQQIVWPGRFDKVAQNPDIIFDVSHNYDGFQKTLNFIESQYSREESHLLIGLLSDKEYRTIAKLISNKFATITITEPVHERCLPGTHLRSELKKLGIESKIIADSKEALAKIRKKLKKNDTLFVMGSHFLVGALLDTFQKRT